MSLLNNADKIGSAFPTFITDKIVGVYSGSFNASTAPTRGGYIAYKAIPHTLTRPAFTKVMVSQDGIRWSDANSSSPFDSSSTIGLSCSDANNHYVLTDSSYGTVYYRLIAYWIDDYDTTNPLVDPTVGSSSSEYFDGRLNYQKIYDQDVLSNPAAPFLTHTVGHSLGYEPNVRVYCESMPGEVWPATFGGIKNYWLYDFNFIECEPAIYTDRVEFLVGGGIASPASRLWYGVYYDG